MPPGTMGLHREALFRQSARPIYGPTFAVGRLESRPRHKAKAGRCLQFLAGRPVSRSCRVPLSAFLSFSVRSSGCDAKPPTRRRNHIFPHERRDVSGEAAVFVDGGIQRRQATLDVVLANGQRLLCPHLVLRRRLLRAGKRNQHQENFQLAGAADRHHDGGYRPFDHAHRPRHSVAARAARKPPATPDQVRARSFPDQADFQ